ncbi:vitamin K epoxide reductase family protein [Spirulina sp. 06S082]|uniref:vitamin K epoxide reductase family protein n=1 Tax=Spirulina sp. 06S082 TaxID=3110248 RepID=UPI002B20463F|nr:vitamin K epoxide reductase family protein [Spirulina sp. 06S082]MEA5472551.1 vitamin K epoxide reductase family protein [Spirulina sp. 06S082]
MNRNRSLPWIYQKSRWLIGAIALLGFALTSYLTITKLTGNSAICFAEGDGCNIALSSSYATVFGLPLSLYGGIAYLSMAVLALIPAIVQLEDKSQRDRLENWSWNLLLIGGTAMTAVSSYLVYLLAFELHIFCPYCLASATFSLSLFVLTLLGRLWEDWGQVFFTGILVAIVTVVGTLGVYANEAPPTLINGRIPIPALKTASTPGIGWDITTKSSTSEIALAQHLSKIGAKMYGAYWCPHCGEQKLLLGNQALSQINYIECDRKGKNSQTAQCHAVGITSFPTWEIDGELYPGIQSLEKLAQLSGYEGSQDFKYIIPGLK